MLSPSSVAFTWDVSNSGELGLLVAVRAALLFGDEGCGRPVTGASVICWTKSELEVLQRIEKRMWRTMPGAAEYAPVSTLQEEVGGSGVVARDTKQKLIYQKYLINCDNDLLHEVYEDGMLNEAGDWNRDVREYCGRLELGEGRDKEDE